jgi:hypothetical protein
MMSTILINKGVNSLGNTSNQDISLNNVNANLNSVKVLIDGTWKSWTIGTPEQFQGTNTIEKGKGFVSNASDSLTIDVVDEQVDINTVNISSGLNFLCFPYNKQILNGLLPRIKTSTMKTFNNNWISWVKDAPNEFQGFTNINNINGYICNIEKVYGTYIDNNKREADTGVRIGTSYMNDVDNDGISGIIDFTPDSLYQSISHDIVSINPGLPKLDLWVKINNVVKLLKYPMELNNTRFSIKEPKMEITDYGSITSNGIETINKGLITDNTVTYEDIGNLTGSFALSTVMYSGVLAVPSGNSEVDPLIINDIITIVGVELMYDIIPFNNNNTFKSMYINIDGDKFVIEFAIEYVNKPLIIIKNGEVKETTFVVSNAFINL